MYDCRLEALNEAQANTILFEYFLRKAFLIFFILCGYVFFYVSIDIDPIKYYEIALMTRYSLSNGFHLYIQGII